MLNFAWGEKYGKKCALLLGGFDGIHKGHETLLFAAKNMYLPVATTTIYGCKAGGDVFTRREREYVFTKAGVDAVVHIPFDEIKNLSAEDFIKALFSNLSVGAIFCGEDFRFGRGAIGDALLLNELSPCPVTVLPLARLNGKKIAVSSGKEYLKEGNLPAFNALVAHPYFIEGEVERGRQVGRTLDFPTANLTYPHEKFPLREGVYGGEVETDGVRYLSIINFGARPTFGVDEKKIEAYLLNFEGDLYGRTIRVYPQKFLRPVYKFMSVEELKSQLKRDIGSL